MTARPSDLVVNEAIAIAAPPELVWNAIIDEHSRADWWAHLELDAHVGGRFEERWHDEYGRPVHTCGHVLEMQPCRLLRLNWSDDDWPDNTEVEIQIEQSEDGTVVTVRHTGWDGLRISAALAERHRAGWRMHLGNLRDYCDARTTPAEVVWFEVRSSDIEAAREFYSALFGWTFRPMTEQSQDYLLIEPHPG